MTSSILFLSNFLDNAESFIKLGLAPTMLAILIKSPRIKIEDVLLKERPNLVVVFGDTNSTLAGAISSIKMQIPVAHVEAGYRSFDMIMPEEINRILVDRISQFLFAPTEDAVNNLLSEGSDKNRIFFVGNVMVETLLSHLQKSKKSKKMLQKREKK